jgi:fucose 4-O-acetylase-like acetyltransferase
MYKYFRQLYSVQSTGVAKVFPGLNGAKGLLVLLVVITHCLPHSMALFFLYFFHMPLFMGISGFLLKESSFENGYNGYFIKNFHRLILPWLIASVIFIPISLHGFDFSKLEWADLIYPYYHLWYIPSYILGSVICYGIFRKKIPYFLMLIILGAYTVVWYNYFRDPHPAISPKQLSPWYIGDKRFYSYLLFFILGFGFRNEYIKLRPSPTILLSAMGCSFITIFYGMYHHFNNFILVWFYLAFNIALLIFILIYIAPQNWLQQKLFLVINKNSLGIYLFHPLVIYFFFSFILKDPDPDNHHISNIQGLGISVAIVMLTMGLLWVLKKNSHTNKYLLGNINMTANAR